MLETATMITQLLPKLEKLVGAFVVSFYSNLVSSIIKYKSGKVFRTNLNYQIIELYYKLRQL